MKHTRKQILESIAYWQKQLELGNYKKLNESEEFKKIDDIVEYLKDKKLKWTKVVKFQRIEAKQSDGGEEIETIGSDGNKETKRTTKKGDWIVNNVSNKENKWIIDDKTFKKKYEEDKNGVYKPKGGPMLAAKVSDCEDAGVEFAPPNWGGDVIKIKNDGWFMKDPSNEKDIYAISKKDFDSTYKPEKSSSLNESKIADFFGKLFKTKKFLAKQAELQKAETEKFMKEHPLAAVAKKMSDESRYLMIKFTNADIENDGYPIDVSKKADCIVVRYVDNVNHRYDDIQDEKEKIMKFAKACGCSDDCEFYAINNYMAVIMPKLNKEWCITQVNEY